MLSACAPSLAIIALVRRRGASNTQQQVVLPLTPPPQGPEIPASKRARTLSVPSVSDVRGLLRYGRTLRIKESMRSRAVRLCEIEGCNSPIVETMSGNSSHCRSHLEWLKGITEEENNPGWRTLGARANVQLTIVADRFHLLGVLHKSLPALFGNRSPTFCCDGEAVRESFAGWLMRVTGLSPFDFRAVQNSSGLYNIRREWKNYGLSKKNYSWSLCQCGGWMRYEDSYVEEVFHQQQRNYASSATAEKVAWKLQRGIPTGRFWGTLGFLGIALLAALEVSEEVTVIFEALF